MNMSKLVLSLAVPSLVFNCNSRKGKQTFIVFDLKYKVNFKSKQVKHLLFTK